MFGPPVTFATFLATAENRPALLAAREVAKFAGARRPRRRSNPLFLHGQAGTGKTHLAQALVARAVRLCPDLTVNVLAGADLVLPSDFELDCDLLVVEDLQHLPLRAAERFVELLDFLLVRKRQVVVTASTGPRDLVHRGRPFPARLLSRLASGLVVWLPPLLLKERFAFLREQARRRQLTISPDVLCWLAEHLPGSARQLLGALTQLEALARHHGPPADLATVESLFQQQDRSVQVSVERIARTVGGYFQVEPSLLQSRQRRRGVLWPRQVGMYLARKLTTLSLEQIGEYFGGRDHSTVLHACRKVEAALTSDVALSGAVHQLHADLA
jgi:chromosomal replication initiator protein